MKKILAAASAAAVAVLGMAVPATADTTALPYGGTATLTIPDVTLNPTGGCVSHYGSLSVSHLYDWDVDITANGPSTWPASDFLYGDGPQTRIVELLLCPTFDKPGTYTASGLMSVYDDDYNTAEALISDQFVISAPAPPVVPTPVPPTPTQVPAPTVAPVTGKVQHKMTAKGVQFTFKSNATPAGLRTGKSLVWKVTYDNRTRTIRQGPSKVSTMTLNFPQGGRHVVKVFRNGTRVKTVTVRG